MFIQKEWGIMPSMSVNPVLNVVGYTTNGMWSLQPMTPTIVVGVGTTSELLDILNRYEKTRKALWDVLDSQGALGGSWHELLGDGFTAERAQEIIKLADNA